MADDVNFSYFSTQFSDSIVRIHYDASGGSPGDRGHWFGRFIDFPYELQNWDGNNSARDGLTFWNQLLDGFYKIVRFDVPVIGTYNLVGANPPPKATHYVDCKGEIEYITNNTTYIAELKFRHYLRPTWVAVKTKFTTWAVKP